MTNKLWPINGSYVITGTDAKGKRFQAFHCNNLLMARGYNVYNGTLWQEDTNGKRTRVMVWYN